MADVNNSFTDKPTEDKGLKGVAEACPLPVGHHNGGPVGTHVSQRSLNVALGLGVQG